MGLGHCFCMELDGGTSWAGGGALRHSRVMRERWRPSMSLLISESGVDSAGLLGEFKTLAGSTPMVIKVLQCLRTCLSSHVNLLTIKLPPPSCGGDPYLHHHECACGTDD